MQFEFPYPSIALLSLSLQVLSPTKQHSSLAALPTTSARRTHINTLSRRLIYLCRVDDSLLNIRRQAVERLLHIDVALGRDLQERYSELVCKLLAALRGDDALVFPIAFVANEDLVYAFRGMLFDVGEPDADI